MILDEVHHGGDALSWGDAVREAFEPATRRLALTGTPFRSDTSPIPFVDYEPDATGIRRSRADHTYGYGDALRDGVVRPVIFLSYSGQMRWRTQAGDEVSARLGEPLTKDVTAQAWRTALDPDGEWMPAVLAAADTRLTEVRRGVPGRRRPGHRHRPDRRPAPTRRSCSGSPGRRRSWCCPTTPAPRDRIEEFRAGEQRWMVAVRMVSEGVDVPRLAVGVYATSTSTPLFFAQAVGRFVRARRRGETASVFLPSVPVLLGLAGELEVERDHALDRPDPARTTRAGPPRTPCWPRRTARRRRSDALERPGFEALEAQATFDRVLFDAAGVRHRGRGRQRGGAGLPRHPRAARARPGDHAAAAAAGRSARRPRRRVAAGGAVRPSVARGGGPPARSPRCARSCTAWSGPGPGAPPQPHAAVHAELRRVCGGPEVPQASADELQQRIDTVRRWHVGGR